MSRSEHFVVFPSELGWMAMAGRAEVVCRVAFGHPSPASAERALRPYLDDAESDHIWFADLVERLQAYAGGARDDFRDVPVDVADRTDFQQRVVEQCRKIPPGVTISYAQLAAAVGRPRAARAVGNVMRSNPLPLLVPCHRVVGSGGDLGGYSAIGGLKTKRRLLDLEAAAWLWEATTAAVEAV